MKNTKKIVLDLCGGTGAWSKPYVDSGYEVINITLPDYDILRWKDYPEIIELVRGNKVHGILAAPPCTMFSIARNDITAKKKRDLREGYSIVQACLDIIHECLYEPFRIKDNSLKFWALENPRGYLDRFLGKQAFEFDPFDFGDPYTKHTYLWGHFKEPKKKPIKPQKFGNSEGTFVKEVEHFKHMKQDQLPESYQKKRA